MNPWAVVADIDGGGYGTPDWTASQVKSLTVGIDNITITGVRAYAYNTVDQFQFSEAGESGYIIKLENNPLINEDNMAEIATRVNGVVGGMRFQPFKGTIYGDPSMVAGDSIAFQDYRGRQYTSFITNLTYSIRGTCEVSLGAETPNEKDLEFSNPTTGVIQGATRAAYDYISARKIDGDVINAHTLNIDALDNTSREEVDTANGQITTISGGGISVHEENDDDNAVEITSRGVGIIRNGKEVALFGDSAIIGRTDQAHQEQTASGVNFINTNQEVVGTIQFGGGTEYVVDHEQITTLSGTVQLTPVVGSVRVSLFLNLEKNGSGRYEVFDGVTITLGNSASATFDISNSGGDKCVFSITSNAANETISYTISLTDGNGTPVNYYSIAFGAINVGHDTGIVTAPKMAFGEGTTAASGNQAVFGMYNAEDTNGDYSFIVGVGGGENRRENSFAISIDGETRTGLLFTGCNSDSTGGTRVNPSYDNDDSQSAVTTNTGTATELDSIHLSKGTWVIQATVVFASNGTGVRGAWLSTSSGGSYMAGRARDMRPALSGFETTCHVTYIYHVTTDYQTLHLIGYQNSGGQLNATPRWAIFGNAEYDL